MCNINWSELGAGIGGVKFVIAELENLIESSTETSDLKNMLRVLNEAVVNLDQKP